MRERTVGAAASPGSASYAGDTAAVVLQNRAWGPAAPMMLHTRISHARGAASTAGRAHTRNDNGFTFIETMFVLVIIALVTAIAVPSTDGMREQFRLTTDARGLAGAVALAKLRAAAAFSRARVRVDLTTRTYRLEVWQKTGTPDWITEGGSTSLSSGVRTGFGSVGSAPPNTQAVIAQAPRCLTSGGAAIDNTACLLFNSRGIPVDASGSPTATGAVYFMDDSAVFCLTVSATGFVQLWRTRPTAVAWVRL